MNGKPPYFLLIAAHTTSRKQHGLIDSPSNYMFEDWVHPMKSFDGVNARSSAGTKPDERPFQDAQPAANVPTEELEQRLLEAVLSLEANGRLPGPLHNSVRRYRQIQRELETHMRGPLVLSRDEYAEIGASRKAIRSRIVDLCLQNNMFT